MEKIIFVDEKETNYLITSDGKVFNRKTKRELKGTYKSKEYHCVQLMVNGKAKSFMVHRLVAQAFCENPKGYTIVDHIDRNKLNNNYTNLRWVSASENQANTKEHQHSEKKQFLNFTKDEASKMSLVNSNYIIYEDGTIVNKKNNRILKGSLRNGYIRININNKYYSAHVLVWEAFNGPKPEGMVIDHIDGNRSNNCLSNLRLVSQNDNMKNMHTNGNGYQVPVRQYDKKGNYLNTFSSFRAAAQAVNGNESAIRQAAERRGTSQGFFWIREDDNITIEEVLKITPTGKPKKMYIGVSQYDLDRNFIRHYDSMAEVAKIYGCTSKVIKRVGNGSIKWNNCYWLLEQQK